MRHLLMENIGFCIDLSVFPKYLFSCFKIQLIVNIERRIKKREIEEHNMRHKI